MLIDAYTHTLICKTVLVMEAVLFQSHTSLKQMNIAPQANVYRFTVAWFTALICSLVSKNSVVGRNILDFTEKMKTGIIQHGMLIHYIRKQDKV